MRKNRGIHVFLGPSLALITKAPRDSKETSRIVRVGTRNYIVRIAAVSQEHVLVCITRRSNTARQ